MVCNGAGVMVSNKAAASPLSRMTISVMRSWMRGLTASITDGGSDDPGISRRHATPRSMRLIFFSPQLWTMSVALLDHGDMVPGRGVTSNNMPVAGLCRG